MDTESSMMVTAARGRRNLDRKVPGDRVDKGADMNSGRLQTLKL